MIFSDYIAVSVMMEHTDHIPPHHTACNRRRSQCSHSCLYCTDQ